MIIIKDLFFSYGENDETSAINDLNMQINKNEFVSIIGKNGCGKSTLSKLLNGILIANRGTITIDGTEINETNINEIRRKIGVMFQNPENQFVASTVEEDIAFGLENLQIERDEMTKRIDWALEVVEMLSYKKSLIHALSGGQKQRIAIASVISMKTEIIVLDEPTSMLDPFGRKKLIEFLKKLKNMGKTIILITHNIEEIVSCDKTFIIEEGKVKIFGKPKEVITDVTKIKNMGLPIPDATELSFLLNQRGINIPISLTNDECVSEILKKYFEYKN